MRARGPPGRSEATRGLQDSRLGLKVSDHTFFTACLQAGGRKATSVPSAHAASPSPAPLLQLSLLLHLGHPLPRAALRKRRGPPGRGPELPGAWARRHTGEECSFLCPARPARAACRTRSCTAKHRACGDSMRAEGVLGLRQDLLCTGTWARTFTPGGPRMPAQIRLRAVDRGGAQSCQRPAGTPGGHARTDSRRGPSTPTQECRGRREAGPCRRSAPRAPEPHSKKNAFLMSSGAAGSPALWRCPKNPAQGYRD